MKQKSTTMYSSIIKVLLISGVTRCIHTGENRQRNEFTTECNGNLCEYVVHIKTDGRTNGTTTVALPRQLLNQITQLNVLLSKLAQVIKQDVSQTTGAIGKLKEEIRMLKEQYNQQKVEFNNKTKLLESKLLNDIQTLKEVISARNTSKVLQEGAKTDFNAGKISGTDCASLYKTGYNQSGVYTIHLDSSDNITRFDVYCDMVTDGGGWTVIQRRAEGSDDFYRNWDSYKRGFGGLNHDFWLGLDKIHLLTKYGNNRMRFNLWNWNMQRAYSEFRYVRIGDEKDKYRILAGKYNGNAGDPFHTFSYAQRMQSMQFSTYDNDNDMDLSGNCARTFNSGWWFNSCFLVNLNGVWYSSGSYFGKTSNGIIWDLWRNHTRGYSLMKSKIKLRPDHF